MNGKFTRSVIMTITAIWVVCIVVGIVNPRYSIPSTVQLAMGAVCGFLLGEPLISKARKDREKKP